MAESTKISSQNEDIKPNKLKIIWFNVVLLGIIHILAIYGYKTLIFDAKILTVLWTFVFGWFTGIGVTGGAHRLWTHRSYKATLPLRIILATAYVASGMNSLFDWVRDHRVHHKFSETDADPHNATRGLFFSHVGWLLQKKHPEVIRRGRDVDMSDVLQDPVVAFEEKHFRWLQLLFCFAIPIWIPCALWEETLWTSTFCTISRWVTVLNIVWSVNSFAHIYGNRPYNKNINPAENLAVSILSLGEGWHNYHHTFPWDYKTAEFGIYSVNFTTAVIDMFAYIGWAYDLKQPSKNLVQKIVQQNGDGTHFNWDNVKEVPEEESFMQEEKIKGI